MTAAQDRIQREVAAELAREVDTGFERLVTTYRHRIFAFVLNLTNDRAVADDLAQETFVAAYRALRAYDAPRRSALSIRAWLYTIAANRVRNYARDRRAAKLVPLESIAEPMTPDLDGPGAQAERAEGALELRRAIAALAMRYRVPLVLRHIDGYRYSEIATLLGQPVGTVKSNVSRGLAALRQSCKETQDAR